MVDKAHILNELKRYKNFTTNAEFARFLQITPQNLANWYKRNTFDVNLLANLFTNVNKSWLLTGEGEMLKNNTSVTGDITNNKGVISNVVGNGNKVETGADTPKGNDFQRLMDIMEKQGDQYNERLMESQAQINKLIELLSKN